jgi:SPP1 gp7 family putative phage head morphogenesis protein
MIALTYRRKLLKGIVADVNAALRRRLSDGVLQRLAAEGQAKHTLKGDAPEPTLAEIINAVAREIAAKWTTKRSGQLAEAIGGELAKFHAGQMNAQLYEIVGIDVVGNEPWLAPTIAEFTRQNVALIKSIPAYSLDRVERALNGRIVDGDRWESLRDELLRNEDVTESKATLIARDQTGKLYGDLNQLRQRDLGFDSYIWRTMRDNRVRDAHDEREGQVYRWDDPPPGDAGEGGHPGEAIQCRCYAEPNVSALMESEGVDTSGLAL